jgi:hypothetical protein
LIYRWHKDSLSRSEVALLARFDDYHRTVVGYHGTGLSTALRIVNRVEGFRWSRRSFDWLGHGIYFWEYAPEQARNWAMLRRQQLRKKKKPTADDIRRADEPIAVVASMIRLGFCFDLLEPYNVKYLLSVFEEYRQTMELAEEPLPENNRKYRKLDCAVFEYAYKVINTAPEHPSVDAARGVYVPAGGVRRVWDASWISRDTHIQLCVRNPACILGTWLHHPTGLGIDDVKKALQDGQVSVEPQDRRGGEEPLPDVEGETDRPDGGGEGHDPRASRAGQEEVG